MKVGILFDGASATAPDQLITGTVDAVAAELASEGNEIVRVPVHDDVKWIERLRRARVDLVFNLCESIDGVAAMEPPVISVLELDDVALPPQARRERRARAGRPAGAQVRRRAAWR